MSVWEGSFIASSGRYIMPIERRPRIPLPPNYLPPGGTPYRVKTDDDLASVAKAHGITVEDLVIYNFKTVHSAEINWYLRQNVGCVKATHDRKNWMFTSDARPGIIYLPPKDGWKRPSFPSSTPGKLSSLPKPVDVKKRSGLWFGLGGQEGGTLAVVGKDTVEACVYSLESYHDRFWMNIDGWRFGLGLGASIGLAVVVATGVEHPTELKDFPVGGFDFQANLAGKWGDLAKAAKGLNAVRKFASGAKIVDKTISLAEWEKLRDLIWNLSKAAKIDSHKTDVNVMAIPGAGVGLEISGYYGFGSVFVHDITLRNL
jgi:hypothetical protein